MSTILACVNNCRGPDLVVDATGVELANNTAGDAGGGLYALTDCQVTWHGGSIHSNEAQYGGGVYLESGDASVRSV